ncbi:MULTISPECIES: hypothetical protein [Cyanophyceae]|uniref:hypothetical protein n=1 Tax=Cyanophyceae TaxID=3028117 RepID=UPI0016870FF9|nr:MULTISPECIES: hypothetical protein [Cyanophyceae]MBD1919449.1 hypothetical protein [Phormidium sp. FACHB-77]MBD2054301.1 hypothetical protein [Leptolyngbya sp. FACHB-60]
MTNNGFAQRHDNDEDNAPEWLREDALLEEMVDGEIEANARASSDFDSAQWMGESSHPALDALVEQSAHEGPLVYLEAIRSGIAYQIATAREVLLALRVTEGKGDQLDAYAQFAYARDSLLWVFHSHFPKPPFMALRRIVPIRRSLLRVVWIRTGFTWSFVEQAVYVLIDDTTSVKKYLVEIELLPPLHRRQYLARFYRWLIVDRCRRVKRARYLRALNRLRIATDDVGAFLTSYLDHHLLNMAVRRDCDEPPTFD